MANYPTSKDVSHEIPVESSDCKDCIYLEETFYILTKKNSVFRVRLTSKGLCLRKESEGRCKEQTIYLRDIIGSRCMRSKRRVTRGGSCVCSSLQVQAPLKVVDENSGDLDENDISAYLYVYAYILKPNRRSAKRERTTITLRFRSFDKYDDNIREAQKWRSTIKCLINNVPVSALPPANDKKLLVLLNPKSGPGKAREIFQQKIAPILSEAEVPIDLYVTKYANYAREFVRTRNVYNWRGVVAVGGDGVLFEILNGFFERLDWQQALEEVPLGIVPCGSGNGLARSISYIYNEPYIPGQMTGHAMALAKGRTTAMDVVRVETKTQIMYSFLSVGWGLLSDIDIESERLRAIGGQRFAVWALARLVGLRKYKGTISYVKINDVDYSPANKPARMLSHSVSQDGNLESPDAEAFVDCADDSSDIFTNAPNQRRQRLDSWYSVNSKRSAFFSTRGSDYHSVAESESDVKSPVPVRIHGPASRLPSLLSSLPSNWTHEQGEFVMVHVSYQSYIGEEFFFAPRSKLCDGVMWMLVVRAGVSRSQLLAFLLGTENAAHTEMNNDFIKFIPVSAFRLVPEGNEGYLTVDGELVEYGPVQAEIFPNLVEIIVPEEQNKSC